MIGSNVFNTVFGKIDTLVSLISLRKKKNNQSFTVNSFLASDFTIKGDLQFNGGLDCSGKIDGNVKSNKDSEEAAFFLRSTGMIKGGIVCHYIEIDGAVKGPIEGFHVVVKKNAKILSNIHYHTLHIEEGALIEGQLIPIGGLAQKSPFEGSTASQGPAIRSAKPQAN